MSKIGDFFKRIWTGIGSILSQPTKDRIAMDTIDWIVGKTNETIQKAGLDQAVRLEAAYKPNLTPFMLIGIGLLFVVLLIRR